eukprot:gene5410-5806_t
MSTTEPNFSITTIELGADNERVGDCWKATSIYDFRGWTAFHAGEYSQKKMKFDIVLVIDNPDVELLPEALPSVGKNYIIGGDKLAVTSAKALVPEHLFRIKGFVTLPW